MKSYLSIVCLVILLFASINIYAAKGDTKTKKGVVLKFSGFDLKTFNSQNLFFKTAFALKSNFTFMNNTATEKAPQTASVNSFMTVQRGNTTYIYPYKHKAAVTTLFKTPTAPKL